MINIFILKKNLADAQLHQILRRVSRFTTTGTRTRAVGATIVPILQMEERRLRGSNGLSSMPQQFFLA